MNNNFTNDYRCVSIQHLIELARAQIGEVTRVFRVSSLGTTHALHYIVVGQDSRFLCDCLMHVNLGIPCRHYFSLMRHDNDFAFHLSMIKSR